MHATLNKVCFLQPELDKAVFFHLGVGSLDASAPPTFTPKFTSGAVGGRFGWLEADVCEAGGDCDSGG